MRQTDKKLLLYFKILIEPLETYFWLQKMNEENDFIQKNRFIIEIKS